MTLLELMKKIADGGKCQLCGHDNWTIWHKDQTHEHPTIDLINGVPYYSLSCDNCGNTAFLRKEIIDQRINEVE